MSRPSLLISEPPLQVLPSLAKAIGLNEAIVLQQIQYWIALEQGIEKDGRRWIYNTVEEWQKQFPFWSSDTIFRAIKNLREKELLIAQALSDNRWNRTLYYSINYNNLQDCISASCGNRIRENAESTTADCNSGISAQCETPLPQLAEIIPTETTQRLRTETTTEITSFDALPTEAPSQEPAAVSPKTKATRGTRIPADFTPSAEMVEWAKEKHPGVDLLTATDNFVDYWTAKAGAGATKADWAATWRVWIRNEAGRRSSGFKASPTALKGSQGGVYRTPAQQAAHERGMSTANFFLDLERELQEAGAL